MRRSSLGIALLLALPAAGLAQAKLKPEEVPTFQLRARVLTAGGKQPAGKKFNIRLGVGSQTATAAGKEWSPWLKFGRPEAQATLKGYPAVSPSMSAYPVVVKLQIDGVIDPTQVEAELKFDKGGEVTRLSGELLGPRLGIMLWRDDKNKPLAATMAGYNRRYWKALEGVEVPEALRPKKFPIVERFIGGDDDRRNWKEGIEQLTRAGFNGLMLPPTRPLRELLLKTGVRRNAGATYAPPGYTFPDYFLDQQHDPKPVTPKDLETWARGQARPFLDAGYAAKDVALFAMSDEPAWYYPYTLQIPAKNPAALARFRAYLKEQKLEPADLGAKDWDGVTPAGRSQAKDLPSRRRFYWTTRFFSHDSARHFADCTRALEKAFYPGLPVFTNWNNFNGRSYVPGPVANNPDQKHPDAGMGAHDWMEFGRLRGGTALWTENWFPDGMAYQWSFYCAKLASAARKGGVQFGGYVIGRTAGDREDGVMQNVLCIVGSGGKAIKYFTFGPEYEFPGNCYSENPRLLRKMAETHRMIGAAEDLLWAGKRQAAQVALLVPRSSQVWDAKGVPLPKQIVEVTNTNLNAATVDYMAEVFDLYLALQHANIPVDFVDEDDLSPDGLKPYRVLYVTAPNIPVEGQRGLGRWVRAGGTLVTVAGAGARDRYDEPSSVLSDLTGVEERPRERMLVANAKELKDVARGKGSQGDFTAVGVRSVIVGPKGKAEAAFEDGSPAVVRRQVGRGRVVHFAWMPGLSYWKSSAATKDRLPVGYSESLRRWIVWPTGLAKVRQPVTVSRPLVETPLLLSEGGAALTALNWTGEPLKGLTFRVRLPFAVKSVKSIRRGRLEFEQSKEGVTFSLPLDAADIIELRK